MSVENINGFNHKNIVIKNISLHVVEKGDVLNPCIFFIHGQPTNWREFEKVMEILSKKFYTVAIDLPGIGESKGSLNSYAKENIANYILELINVLNLKNIILVVIFVVLAPLILVGITSLSNALGGKSKHATTQTTEQVAKVPEETKVTNDNLPKAK